jgi:nucleoside-diphosphate-sugar epimerase
MHILIIGGTGFIGRPLVNRLSKQEHNLAVVHRGRSRDELPEGVTSLICQGASLVDRAGLAELKPAIERFVPDVAIDLIAMTEASAQAVVSLLAGIAGRLVVISSQDVYLAYDRLRRLVAGPPESLPLSESARLRQRLYPYRGEEFHSRSSAAGWMDDYDKILVERAATGDPRLPATILRLPRVYGPGDRQHRLYPYARRMADQRSPILLDQALGGWRWTRGYVADVAQAIALAACHPLASGQVYNLGEADPQTEWDWIRLIGEACDWKGQLLEVPGEQLPEHLKFPYDPSHHLWFDTSKIRRELGFAEEASLSESLPRTLEWELANPPLSLPALQVEYAAEDRAIAAILKDASA